MTAKRDEPRVFFPWEKRRGLRGLLARGRARQVIAAAVLALLFLLMQRRERTLGDIRATRAVITSTTRAVAAFRADHDHGCPATLAELVSGGYLHELPRDAWGRALRVTCPGRKDPRGFDVSSDGPDGEPWGLDRVE